MSHNRGDGGRHVGGATRALYIHGNQPYGLVPTSRLSETVVCGFLSAPARTRTRNDIDHNFQVMVKSINKSKGWEKNDLQKGPSHLTVSNLNGLDRRRVRSRQNASMKLVEASVITLKLHNRVTKTVYHMFTILTSIWLVISQSGPFDTGPRTNRYQTRMVAGFLFWASLTKLADLRQLVLT